VDVERPPAGAALYVREGDDPDQEHRHRGEQERRPDDRADRHLVGALVAGDDRDQRDQALGHRGADGGEQAPHRPLPDVEAVAEPLHRVGEEDRAGQDDGEARGEQ
jgi:hypothetical protein